MTKALRSAGVAVLGAGITGAGVALELARRGEKVTLIDQDPLPFNRASLRNEGKIHLGFVYANDRTLATAGLQLRGALSFRSHVARWIGTSAEALRLSSPFVYLVAGDSVLSVDELSEHYAAVNGLYREHLQSHPEHDYLGDRPPNLFCPVHLENLKPFLRTERLAGAFQTAEVAVDTEQLGSLVRGAIRENDLITFIASHRVIAVGRANDRFLIEGDGPHGPWKLEADQVVNALWDQRLLIDSTVGLASTPGWVHRLKYRVIARLPEQLRNAPSVTMVLGRYGDVVIRNDGTAYFSWYPLGMLGWTHDLAPPESWDRACRGDLLPEESAAIAGKVLGAIDAWYPHVAASTPLVVDAGAIFAYGKTDVDDTSSALHNRTRVGVTSRDGFHSVDPGKLTTAPMFAHIAANRVLEAEVTE